MKHLLIAALCGFASLPIFAADTWVIGGTGDAYGVAYDISSLETHGDIKETWTIFVKPKLENGVDYSADWVQFDCRTKKMRHTEASDRKFGSSKVKEIPGGKWYRVEPGTIAKETLMRVCKNYQEPLGDFRNIEEAAKALRKHRKEHGIW